MKVFIIHASAGAGHRKAAEALYNAFTRCAAGQVTVEKIDALDFSSSIFRKSYPAVYIFLVTYIPFVWGILFYLLNFSPLAPFIRIIRHQANAFYCRNLIRYILTEQPDVVVCEHFLSAELVSALKQQGRYTGTVITGVTDFGVHLFWINPGTDYYFVASDMTKDELSAKGVPAEKVMVTGIPIEEKFSQNPGKSAMRAKLGLKANVFTVLVTSGGFGVGPLVDIVRSLERMEYDLQMMVICGKNEPLVQLFEKEKFTKNVKVFGYVHNMDECMEAADVIITKSGGLTVSESLAKGLPMIITKPIPGQETRNAEVIEQYHIGMRLLKVNLITEKIGFLLKDDQRRLNEMRKNARNLARPDAADRMCQWIIKNVSAKK